MGLARVETCLIGNPLQAREGNVRILAGGDGTQIEALSPLLETLGRKVVRLGPAGSAAAVKLAFNALLGAQLAGLSEALSLGAAAGIDHDFLLNAIAESGFSSPVLSFRAELAGERRYLPPFFQVGLMAKDLRLALDDAEGHSLGTPVLSAVTGQFEELKESGQGHLDAAVILDED